MNETVVNCVGADGVAVSDCREWGQSFPVWLLFYLLDFLEEHFEGFLVDSRGGGGAVEGLASKDETRALPHSSRCHRGISAEQRDWATS
jgi:hypothetical protein